MIYEFQATQDLHGYEKPWAGGTETNQFNPVTAEDNKRLNYEGLAVDYTGWCVSDWIPCSPNTDYYANYVLPSANGYAFCFYDSNKEFLRYVVVSGGGKAVRNSGEDSAYMRVTIRLEDKATAGIIAQSSEFLEYSPYANVCMPEGFNIWDPEAQDFIQVYAGYVNANTRELYLRPVYEEYAGEELVGPWMSSLDPYSEDTTPTEGAFVIDFGGELTSFEITPFMLQTLLDSLGIRQHFTDGAGLLNSLMDQAQGRVRSEEELLHLSRPLRVIPIGDQLPAGLTFKPISKDVLPGLPGKFIR